MSLPIFLLEAAEADIAHEIAYYNDKRAGLGDAFLLEVQETLARIAWKPELFPKKHPTLRRALLHRFPFAIGFRIHADFIEIVAVVSTHSHPDLLSSRQ
jgi:plasmid stabilization system protein ParE